MDRTNITSLSANDLVKKTAGWFRSLMRIKYSFTQVKLGSVSLFLFCIAGIAATNPSLAKAYCQLTKDSERSGDCVDSGIALYWRCSNFRYAVCPREIDDPPFELVVDAIEDSFQSWARVDCDGEPLGFDFMRFDDPTECDYHWKQKEDPKHDSSPSENLIIFVQDWISFGYDPHAFALTSVWHDTSSGVIVGADMEMNEDRGPFGVCGVDPKRCNNVADVQNVVTHEIGHILGLGHSQDESAAMFNESASGNTAMRILKSDDIRGVCSIYRDDPPSYCSESERTRSNCSVGGLSGSRNDFGFCLLILASVSLVFVYRRLA